MAVLVEYTCAILVFHVMPASEQLLPCVDQTSGTKELAVWSVMEN